MHFFICSSAYLLIRLSAYLLTCISAYLCYPLFRLSAYLLVCLSAYPLTCFSAYLCFLLIRLSPYLLISPHRGKKRGRSRSMDSLEPISLEQQICGHANSSLQCAMVAWPHASSTSEKEWTVSRLECVPHNIWKLLIIWQ